MTKLKYIQDLHYHPKCKKIKDVESLTHKVAMEHWLAVDAQIRKEHKCTLTAYLLYQHHFRDRSMYELAQELGESRQTLTGLIYMLNIPTRSREEMYTRRFGEKVSLRNSGKKPSLEVRRNISRSRLNLRGNDLDEGFVVNCYVEREIGCYQIARLCKVSYTTIYNCLRRNNIKRRSIKEATQRSAAFKLGKTYEEIYGVKKAEKIKEKMHLAHQLRR